MKFLAISSLIGLGFLAQESHSVLGFDQYMDQTFSFNQPTVTGSFGNNLGFQTLVNGLNSLSNGPSYSNVPVIGPNLKSQPDVSFSTQNNVYGMKVKPDLLALKFINRNFDGTQNNLKNPQWGAKSSNLLRLCPADYMDGKSTMWTNKPNPRDVSNLVGSQEGPIKQSKLGLNMLFTIWGQFLDHDITLSPTNDEAINIPIPRCDTYMDKKCTGKQQFPLRRSIFNPSQQVRTNINVLTPWVDASQVYGSDKATADSLRQFKNGKLKSSDGNLLPRDSRGGFLAGDFRVNENVALTCFQTIFMREHNRICDSVLQKNTNLSDEQVFQIARNYVIGLVQHITFDEYLPALLGKSNFDQLIGKYKYDPSVNPSIFTEFSTASFRLGHPMINAPFKLTDNCGNLIDELQLGEMFFNPKILNSESLSQFLNGLSRTGAKQRSLELVHDLRNFLFFPPNAQVRLDLYSFNIQRGRDHGICSVKAARQKLGLIKKQFKDLFEDKQKGKYLEDLYHNTDNLDLWLAIIGEKAQNGSVLGQLGIRLNALQFKNIMNGDRLWYENTYPESVIKEIKATSFADIIKMNSNVKILNAQVFKKL